MNLTKSEDLESLSKKDLVQLIKQEREELNDLSDAVSASAILSWVYDIESEKLIVGRGSPEILGEKEGTIFSYEELKARVHPEDKELIELNFMQYIEKYPRCHEYYIRILDFEKNYRWIASKGKLFRDEIGVAYKIAGTLRDISDRKQVEDKNMITETRYQLLSECAKEGIIIYDENLVITDLNNAAEEIFEYSSDEIIGLHLDSLVDKKTFNLLEKSKNTGEYVDVHAVKKSGEGIYLELLNKVTPRGIGIFIVNDIHQRKQAEMALLYQQRELEKTVKERTAKIKEQNSELEERKRAFEALLENLQGMAYQYVPKGRHWKTTFISKGSLELTGYENKLFLNENLRVDEQIIVKSFKKSAWKEIRKCIDKKIGFHIQYPIRTKSGAEKWVLDRGIGVYNSKGKLVSLEGLMVDVTREKLQEEKLLMAQQEIVSQHKVISQREKSYGALLTNLQGMAYRVLSDLSTVSYISDGCLSLTGYSQKEILNKKKFFERYIVKKEFQSSVSKVIEKALKNKESYEVGYSIVCKDKTEKWVTERGIGLYDSKGKLEALEGFIIDTSKSKELEKQLRLAQETIDQAPVIIQWIKEDGSFYYVNEEAVKTSGYTKKEFLAQKIHNIDHNLSKKEWSNIFTTRKKKGVKDQETVFVKKDGSEIPALISAFNIEYEGTAYNIAFMNDISRLKAVEDKLKTANNELSTSEEELRQQSEELKTLNENLEIQKKELENTVYQLKNTKDQLIHTEKMASLGVLVAGIAHELNNPIGYIKTSSVALMILLEDLKEEIRKIAGNDNSVIHELSKDFDQMSSHINSGATQAATIVKGLRTFSRMDKEKIEQHNIHSTIDNVLLMLHNSYKYDITIHKDYEDIPMIECAPGQINQVFMNLVNNAIQAIEKKGNIWIKSELNNDRVIVTIKDDGPGIPTTMQSRIFEPFFSTKEPGQGTGLGLSISLGIIQDHDGSIDFESDKKGTTFIVSLPIKQDISKNK